MGKRIFLGFLIFFSGNLLFAQSEDAPECKDHPMFNRMPNFFLASCEMKEFDSFKFPVENKTEEDRKMESVEGKFYTYDYQKIENAPEASSIQVFRNFENALKQIKATIVAKVIDPGNAYSFITSRVTGNGLETWVMIQTSGHDYQLFIVEKQLMEQVIRANEMMDAINKDGFIALNILFDTGKSSVKPESQPLVEQVYELLANNPALKVSIEGHTDNTGTPADNKTLSEARAKSVMDALILKGIVKTRLSSVGWGAEKPVADNRTEEGRAKNRRVEVVKK